MDYGKAIKFGTTLTAIVFLCFFSAEPTEPPRQGWINLTSFKEIRRLVSIDDTLFAATSGGILIVGDPALPGQSLINTDGLGTTDITDIAVDSMGVKWILGFGRLIRLDETSPQQFLFFDRDGALLQLNRLIPEGDLLWVGSEVGLILFDRIIDGGQIQDSYELFGNLNASPVVNDIALIDSNIWLATSEGLAVAVRSPAFQLNSPQSWTGFSLADYPELGSQSITDVVSFSGRVYVTTSKGAFQLRMDTTGLVPLVVDTSFYELSLGNQVSFVSLRVDNDSLFYYFNDSLGGGMGFIVDTQATSMAVDSMLSYPTTGLNNGSFRWLAAGDGGLFENSGGYFVEFSRTGLPGNNISDLLVNQEGQLIAGFSAAGVGILQDSLWFTETFFRATSHMMLDSSQNSWVGTAGGGVWLFSADSIREYDEKNTTMKGNSDGPGGISFVDVRGIQSDGRFMFVACYRAVDDYPLAIGDLQNINSRSGWDSLGLADGITSSFVVSLDIHDRFVALGTEASGVFFCDLGDNPVDHADVVCLQYTSGNIFLISDIIRVVKFSPQGNLWVGTNLGLSRYDPGIELFVDVKLPAEVSSDITSLEFDGRDNLWIGTADGLAFRDGSTGKISVFTESDSPLLSNKIRNIRFDPTSGRTFVATDAGISIIPSTSGLPTSQLNDVIAFPNPFIIRSDKDHLSFNFLNAGTISIYSSAGEKVREISVNQSWDGRNQQNNEVASGVYLFVINDAEGNSHSGKILLVRQ